MADLAWIIATAIELTEPMRTPTNPASSGIQASPMGTLRIHHYFAALDDGVLYAR